MSTKDKDAKENLLVVIVNEETIERYARATGQTGIGTEGRRSDGLADLRRLGGVAVIGACRRDGWKNYLRM